MNVICKVNNYIPYVLKNTVCMYMYLYIVCLLMYVLCLYINFTFNKNMFGIYFIVSEKLLCSRKKEKKMCSKCEKS